MSTNKHYEISAEDNQFKGRSKSVFDNLLTLEKQHQNKRKTYEDELMPVDDNVSNNDVFEFKRPMTSKPKQSSHVTNPEKYTKYSLENVNDNQMSANSNRQAALDFLVQRKTPAGEDEPKETHEPEYNKGLNKINKQQLATEDTEDNDLEIIERVVTSSVKVSETSFRRKGFIAKSNIRQKDTDVGDEDNLIEKKDESDDEDENEIEKASTETEFDSEESFDTNESSESEDNTDIRMALRRPKPKRNYKETVEKDDFEDFDYVPNADEAEDDYVDEEGVDEKEETENEINQINESDTESL